jgi:hypothetical protein
MKISKSFWDGVVLGFFCGVVLLLAIAGFLWLVATNPILWHSLIPSGMGVFVITIGGPIGMALYFYKRLKSSPPEGKDFWYGSLSGLCFFLILLLIFLFSIRNVRVTF